MTSHSPASSPELPDLPYLANRESYAMHEVVSYATAHGRACYEAGSAAAAQAVKQVPAGWIVVKEHAWDQGDGERPTLVYLWPAEFNRQIFTSFETASQFIHESPSLPLGWVALKIADAPCTTDLVAHETPNPSDNMVAGIAPAALKAKQAADIDETMRLTRERDDALDAFRIVANELKAAHDEMTSLRAKPDDPDEVMRLADDYAIQSVNWLSEGYPTPDDEIKRNTAREALRSHLAKDRT